MNTVKDAQGETILLTDAELDAVASDGVLKAPITMTI
jgi:hypothetical protein